MLKEKSYTIPEFLEMQRAGEIYDGLGHKAKKQLQKAFITGLATTAFLINHPSIVFANSGLEEIDVLGMTFLIIVRRIGYWVAILFAIIELIKCVREGGEKQDIMSIVMKYIVIYAALFLIPKAFDFIGKVLS